MGKEGICQGCGSQERTDSKYGGGAVNYELLIYLYKKV
jgi:hypothetical protein